MQATIRLLPWNVHIASKILKIRPKLKEGRSLDVFSALNKRGIWLRKENKRNCWQRNRLWYGVGMKTIIQTQQEAVDSILSAREQGKRAMGFGMTLLNKNPRVIRGIFNRYSKEAQKFGFNPSMIACHWSDIKDMAKLEACSEWTPTELHAEQGLSCGLSAPNMDSTHREVVVIKWQFRISGPTICRCRNETD